MFTCWRRAGQSIEVDGPATFTILPRENKPNHDRKGRSWIRVGVVADRSVKILRSELVSDAMDEDDETELSGEGVQ